MIRNEEWCLLGRLHSVALVRIDVLEELSAPHEITQFPPSGQGPPRTKDTRGLQDPL
jgi:hypothetical protein